jgi:hypothetical protein
VIAYKNQRFCTRLWRDPICSTRFFESSKTSPKWVELNHWARFENLEKRGGSLSNQPRTRWGAQYVQDTRAVPSATRASNVLCSTHRVFPACITPCMVQDRLPRDASEARPPLNGWRSTTPDFRLKGMNNVKTTALNKNLILHPWLYWLKMSEAGKRDARHRLQLREDCLEMIE